jgi:hypothetical protein
MATVLIYNNRTNRMETYARMEFEAMPYITGNTMSVAEFRGSSRSALLWTDRRVMEAWNSLRKFYGRPVHIGYAFKRIWEGGHAAQSQHYAGASFDTGQNLNDRQRAELWLAAVASGVWSYVEPEDLTPTWVHFDKRHGIPACPTGGYPQLKEGDRGIYVLVLQDALRSAGFLTLPLDGVFGNNTKQAIIEYQRNANMLPDGIAGCRTWKELASQVVGSKLEQG